MDITLHPVYTQLLKFLNNSNAREKVLRLLQYLCRALNTKYALKPLQNQLMMARKPLRALRGLTHLKNAMKLLKDQLIDQKLKWINIIREISMGIYFTLDTVQYLNLLKLINYPKVKRWCSIAWTLGLSANLLACLRQWQSVQRNNKNLQSDTLKTLLDLPIAISQLGDIGISDSTLGVFGVITSWIAIKDLWIKSSS